MDSLYMSLEDIYKKFPAYEQFYPLSPLYNQLRDYLITNIKDANYVVRASNFAHVSTLKKNESLDLFLLLSKYGIFIKNYELFCDECDEIIVTENLTDYLYCSCGTKLVYDTNSIDEIFNNLHYLFEISPEYIQAIQETLAPQRFRSTSNDNIIDFDAVQKKNPTSFPNEGIKQETRHLHQVLLEGLKEEDMC